MSLWIFFAFFVVAFMVSAGYVALGAMDPEGRGAPRTTEVIALAIAFAIVAGGFAGALLHRHFS